jgi:hypothetical protein
MAKAGKELIDDQRQAEAKQLLTEYMTKNVALMLKIVRGILVNTRTSTVKG